MGVVAYSSLNCNSGSVDPEYVGTKLFQFNIVSIMFADAQAPCATKTSAPMVLTM